ncbi:MAG: ABC transporter permease [Anaerovoracaceae bacterium]|jgi:osmoprotectant transport system permease protein
MIKLLAPTIEHMGIVLMAMSIAIAISVIIGIIAYWNRYIGSPILWVSDIIQTIPSLALITIMMILMGLGNKAMIAALVLYAIFPIARNTVTGLNEVSSAIRDAAKGMGMSKAQRLLKVELPLAFPMIFSGIKIALVTSLSIAVMGVLIGAGGLGYPIYRGIQTQNTGMIIGATIPVVVMAIVFDFIMSKIEKRLIKRAG